MFTTLVFNDSHTALSFTEWGTIILSVVTFIWTICWSIWLHKQALVNEFWFSSIVGPKTIKPIIKFYSQWDPQFRDKNNFKSLNRAVKLNNNFGIGKDELINQLWLSKLLFNKVHSLTSSKLDEIEDLIGNGIGRMSKHNSSDIKEFDQSPLDFQQAILEILAEIGKKKPKFQNISPLE